MTANNRDANPDIHANIRTAKVIKLLQPAAFRLITELFDVFIVHKRILCEERIIYFFSLVFYFNPSLMTRPNTKNRNIVNVFYL